MIENNCKDRERYKPELFVTEQLHSSLALATTCGTTSRMHASLNTHGTMVPWYYDTMVLWYYDTMVLWYYGTMVLWYHGTMVLWYYGTMVLWYYGTMVLWYYGTIVLWYQAVGSNSLLSINSSDWELTNNYMLTKSLLFISILLK